MKTLASLDDLWSQFGFSPNIDQKRAILHSEGPLYLPAGPGSGKTRVLLWRAINLIACHVGKLHHIGGIPVFSAARMQALRLRVAT